MDRRDLFKLGALTLSMPLLSRVAWGAEEVKLQRIRLDELPKKQTDDAVVYHCDFPEERRFHAMLDNIRNHLSAYDFDPFRIKIVLVANGAGVKFFMKTHKGTRWEKEKVDLSRAKERLSYLSQFEVEFYICDITIRSLGLKYENFFDFVKIVDSGVASVGRLQTNGFGYIKVL